MNWLGRQRPLPCLLGGVGAEGLSALDGRCSASLQEGFSSELSFPLPVGTSHRLAVSSWLYLPPETQVFQLVGQPCDQPPSPSSS